MNPTFDQIARCFAAYEDLDSAFWPFLNYVQFPDEAEYGECPPPEAMRRMLAITMADVYSMEMVDTHYPDAPLVERLRVAESFRTEFLRKADVDIDHQIT